MKITSVQAHYPQYRQPLTEWRSRLWQVAVRIETDVAVTGWGYGGGGQSALPIINHHLADLLVGRRIDSSDDIMAIWDDLYAASIPYGRKGVAIMALSGIDLALWDLLGRAEGVPVHALIGGKNKTKVRAYATGTDPTWYHELGFTAYKFPHRWRGHPPDLDRAVEDAQRARDLFGPSALLMIDSYMSWDAATARTMASILAPYDLYWFEDVLSPDDLAGQAELRREIQPIQLAGGEHEFTHHGFADVARASALDIWQPDITWCGGITAGLRILELAGQVGVRVVPHRGGEVWGLHLIAATDCDDLAEVLPGRREVPVDALWLGQPPLEGGCVIVPDEPGFGVVLNETYIQ